MSVRTLLTNNYFLFVFNGTLAAIVIKLNDYVNLFATVLLLCYTITAVAFFLDKKERDDLYFSNSAGLSVACFMLFYRPPNDKEDEDNQIIVILPLMMYLAFLICLLEFRNLDLIDEHSADLVELKAKIEKLNWQLIRKDVEVSELHRSNRELVEYKDLEISVKNTTIESYQNTIKNLMEKKRNFTRDTKTQRQIKERSSSLMWSKEIVRELETRNTYLQKELLSSKDTATANEEILSDELSTTYKDTYKDVVVEDYAHLKKDAHHMEQKLEEKDAAIKALNSLEKLMALLKRRNEIISKEKEEIRKENQTLSKQLEKLKQAERSDDQIMKDQEEKSTGIEEPSDAGGDLPRDLNKESEKEVVEIPVGKEYSKVSEQTIDINEVEHDTVESQDTEPSHATLPQTPPRKRSDVPSCSDTTNKETTQIQEESNADMSAPCHDPISTGVEEPSDAGGDLPRDLNMESEKELVEILVRKEYSKVSEQTIDINEVEQETVESQDTEPSHATLPQTPPRKCAVVSSCSDTTNKETTQIQEESKIDIETVESQDTEPSHATLPQTPPPMLHSTLNHLMLHSLKLHLTCYTPSNSTSNSTSHATLHTEPSHPIPCYTPH
ncbi:hypothetical protein ACFE04_015570 [Oxalis oulophora]